MQSREVTDGGAEPRWSGFRIYWFWSSVISLLFWNKFRPRLISNRGRAFVPSGEEELLGSTVKRDSRLLEKQN
jgi:hypothetical protein